MTDNLARNDNTPAPGMETTLEHLTFAYAEMVERHGPLLGMDGVKPPAEAIAFAASQAELANAQDAESEPGRSLALMLERNAREHEQMGRLASFIAGYELTHGDPGHAPSMMELGGGHFDLAAECRATLAAHGGLTANQNAASETDKLFPPASVEAVAAELTTNPTNDRSPTGRGY